MNAQMHRISAIHSLAVAKIFAFTTLWGRTLPGPTRAITTGGAALVIVFSFVSTASMIVAGMKDNDTD